MKAINFLVLFAIVSPSFLFSKSYVKLTNHSSRSELIAIKHKLNRLGLRVIFKQRRDGYFIIYTGPYKSENYAKYVQKRLKRSFPYSVILTKRKDKKVIKPVVIKSKIVKESKDRFFIPISIGYASTPSTHTIKSGSVTINKPKTDGYLISTGIGYLFDNISFTLDYDRIDTKDLLFSNISATIDYRFEKVLSVKPYFGIIGGYSSLKWSVDPIDNPSTQSNNDSKSPFYGTNAGILYNFSKDIELFSSYQCIFMDHTTNIELSTTDKSKLQHNISHSIEFGLNYKF